MRDDGVGNIVEYDDEDRDVNDDDDDDGFPAHSIGNIVDDDDDDEDQVMRHQQGSL